jgi:hypothetical protein
LLWADFQCVQKKMTFAGQKNAKPAFIVRQNIETDNIF